MYYQRMLLLIACCAALLQAAAQPGQRGISVPAAATAFKGQTYAIIIGISDYKQVRKLHFAHRDAEAFHDFLRSEAGGSVPKEHIELLINDRATRDNVGDAITSVIRKVKEGDRVYFFFAGHGDMEDYTQMENGLLLLYNSPNGNYFGMTDDVLQILDLKRYLSQLGETKGADILFIIDACHSGNLSGGIKGTRQTGAALLASWGKEYKILSCQPNQLSVEDTVWGGGRGLFSWCFEEAVKGLADTDNNGEVSMFELDAYLKKNVSQFSEYRQIPVVTGDLERSFFRVNPATVAALRKLKDQSYPMVAVNNGRAASAPSPDSLRPAARALYEDFQRHLADRALVWPLANNALRDYRAFAQLEPESELTVDMRRSLAAALNVRFNDIVTPQLHGETSYSTRDECYYAAMELDSCLGLLGTDHYLYPNLKARKLYMDAMALTWAISEEDYNVVQQPLLEESIRLLEESARLEPNAAYTYSALGQLHYLLNNFDSSFRAFGRYVSLRPNDFYAKYTPALLYMKLKAYDKAAPILRKLLDEYPAYTFLKGSLFECAYYGGRKQEARALAQDIARSDSTDKHFTLGIYYALESMTDSAVYYYSMAAAGTPNCGTCYNNIGHAWFMAGRNDSARHYLNRSIAVDSSAAASFPLFSLASINMQEGAYSDAINGFFASYAKAPARKEAFFARLDRYFNKQWSGAAAFEAFQRKTLKFELQYMDLVSIYYCLLRDTLHQYKEGAADTLFAHMLTYKIHEGWSWYHDACRKAIAHDSSGALQSLGKALQLGFGQYEMMQCDGDLAPIRESPEYTSLLKKYFPGRERKSARGR